MSAVIPNGRADQIEFFKDRLQQWTDKAAELGLSAAQMTAFTPLVNGAVSAEEAAAAARLASRNATQSLHNAVDAMTAEGRALVATIKAYAEATGNPEVYTLASIPMPKKPAPLPPPAMPTQVAAALQPDGTIQVEWEASVANTAFTIWRRIDTGAGFGPVEQVGTVGSERAMIDNTLPGCVLTAAYSVRAVRGTQVSPVSAEANIRFTPGGESQQEGQQAQAA